MMCTGDLFAALCSGISFNELMNCDAGWIMSRNFASIFGTLLAGFASTVGWPLTSWGAETVGWRTTCLYWACAHILLGLPLNLFLLPRTPSAAAWTRRCCATWR